MFCDKVPNSSQVVVDASDRTVGHGLITELIVLNSCLGSLELLAMMEDRYFDLASFSAF